MFSFLEIVAVEHVAQIFFIDRGEYMRSALKILPDSPNISDLTDRDVSELNVSPINGKL